MILPRIGYPDYNHSFFSSSCVWTAAKYFACSCLWKEFRRFNGRQNLMASGLTGKKLINRVIVQFKILSKPIYDLGSSYFQIKSVCPTQLSSKVCSMFPLFVDISLLWNSHISKLKIIPFLLNNKKLSTILLFHLLFSRLRHLNLLWVAAIIFYWLVWFILFL